MTTLANALSVPFGLRFSLDSYTTWYNSPYAAVIFWSVFAAVVLLVVLITMWVFRRMQH
jgi:hypothetical protein